MNSLIKDRVTVCDDHNNLSPITLATGAKHMRDSVGSAAKLEETDLGSTMVLRIDIHGERWVILHMEVDQVMKK